LKITDKPRKSYLGIKPSTGAGFSQKNKSQMGVSVPVRALVCGTGIDSRGGDYVFSTES